MRRVAVVGAGQSGTQLALGLLGAGYEVTLVSNRTPDDIRAGRVLSSQCMFETALQTERALGLDRWEQECPPVEGISFAVPDGAGGTQVSWAARLDSPAQSVDQRLKVPRGSRSSSSEAAAGDRGGRRGRARAVRARARPRRRRDRQGRPRRACSARRREVAVRPPQRALALTYVTGMTPRPEFSAVSFNLVPGVGEYFVFPALTTTGPCEIMVFEGIPGGPMDCWEDVRTPKSTSRGRSRSSSRSCPGKPSAAATSS